METQIVQLAAQVELVIKALAEGLKTGSSEGQEIKVALAKLSDEAVKLKGATASHTLDEVYAKVKELIAGIELDPDLKTNSDSSSNENFHNKISNYLEIKFYDKVVNETYARVVGNSEGYPDGDKILNTFKELQAIIGSSTSTDSSGEKLASILSRLTSLGDRITTEIGLVNTRIGQEVGTLQNSINQVGSNAEASAKAALDKAVEVEGKLSTFTTNYSSDQASLRSSLEGMINTAQGDLEASIEMAQGNITMAQESLTELEATLDNIEKEIGKPTDFVAAVSRVAGISIKSIWSI